LGSALPAKAERPNLTISVHQCHEMRAGNTDRIDAVMTAVGPYMDIVTICGSDKKVNDKSKDWSDVIKPLGEGDYDPKEFLRALKRHKFQGPIILHTYGLMNKPASHYQTSFDLYQKMRAEVDAEN
jgi:sugar phosphate isomerase/epimerase